MTTTNQTNKNIKDGFIRLEMRNAADDWNDAEVRLAIQTLRAVLLERQQKRATKAYLKTKEAQK